MAMPENDDELRTVRASGRVAELTDGRSVFAGWSDDGTTVLKFTNNQGTETKFALHNDAADALKTLLNEGPQEICSYRLVVSFLAQGIDAPSGGETREARFDPKDESPTPQSGDAPNPSSSRLDTEGDSHAG